MIVRFSFLFLLLAVIGSYVFFQVRHGMAEIDVPKSDKPIYMELYTSQSCSSCPPADKNLGVLLKNKNVIGLSCHVTYWDHLRWKDTRSQDFCTYRQREMNKALGRHNVYTPQLVINGRYQVSGNRELDINASYNKALGDDLYEVLIEPAEEGVVRFHLPSSLMDKENMRFIVFGYEANPLRQVIGDGENSGEVVTYYNSVLSYHRYELSEVDDLLFSTKANVSYVALVEGKRTFRVFAVGDFNP